VSFTSGLIHAFHREHQRRYGYQHAKKEIELVTLRLRSTMKAVSTMAKAEALPRSKPQPVERSFVNLTGKPVPTPIHSRESLQPGRKQSGPAIITEYSATTVVPPGDRFFLERAGNLLIELKKK
jgi:N-methylhydantoinase A